MRPASSKPRAAWRRRGRSSASATRKTSRASRAVRGVGERLAPVAAQHLQQFLTADAPGHRPAAVATGPTRARAAVRALRGAAESISPNAIRGVAVDVVRRASGSVAVQAVRRAGGSGGARMRLGGQVLLPWRREAAVSLLSSCEPGKRSSRTAKPPGTATRSAALRQANPHWKRSALPSAPSPSGKTGRA
ncbi:hypothetical protein AB0L05_25735 [Nonomuraea pusilla]|uniref:hypothetical protein n=1 Tax=Nonomuraea pusilla TaxID=46177 RepID=UPI0033173800